MQAIVYLALIAAFGLVQAEFDQAYLNEIAEIERTEFLRNLNFSRAYSCPRTCIINGAKAKSVHELRPGDIEVIGAIGDSLTAANGAQATTILGLLTEYRGVSWNMGIQYGINDVFTLANQILFCSPNLVGGSTGSGKNTDSKAGFNLANPGDTSNEMLGQAKELVKRITSQGHSNKWKLITFFIGGNDLCKSCNDKNYYSPKNFQRNIKETLDYFQANLPKAFISLVMTLDVTGIETLTGTTCRNMQKTLCKCGLDDISGVQDLGRQYQKLTEELLDSGKYDGDDQFTVVLHKFMQYMTPPTTNGQVDYKLFAPDCFHFSQKGHILAGVELWNSLVVPNYEKQTQWVHINNGPFCPNEKTQLHTNESSRKLKALLLKQEQEK